MNLYELAHHPDAWNTQYDCPSITFCLPNKGAKAPFSRISEQQWDILTLTETKNYPDEMAAWAWKDENCFRMHLLFVYFATTPESEWMK